MKNPTFFISSTIYDFKDLRSSLKFYLEQQGCTVLASEYPDFSVNLDKHSYQACLDAIGKADYFILLIGARTGGWYDKTNRISITQQEYREAYSLHKVGKLKILSFARSEVWELKENRNELERYLATTALPLSDRAAIAKHSSKRFEDADFIINFLNEVSRNSETKTALENGASEFPTGNWLYNFSSFKDIVDAVQSQIFRDTPLEEASIKHLLSLELRENLKTLLPKLGTHVADPEVTVINFYCEHEITNASADMDVIHVNYGRWSLLSSLGLWLLNANVQDRVLDYCLKSSLFVEFDSKTNRVTSSPVFNALAALNYEIQKFRKANVPDNLSVIFKYTNKAGYSNKSDVPVNAVNLLTLLHLYDRWITRSGRIVVTT